MQRKDEVAVLLMTENDGKIFSVVSQLLCNLCVACLETRPNLPVYKAVYGPVWE